MTEISTLPEPEDVPDTGRTRKILIAVVVALLVILGIKLWFVFWWRKGGPRRAITGIAEEGAVKLTDALLDEVLGPA